MKGNLLLMSLLIVSIFLLNACDDVEKVQHIEVYVIFEPNGYKKVNAITTIEESKNHMKTDIKAIEDFYDKKGNYIKTEIIHTSFNKSYITRAEGGENRKEEINEPSTILIPNDNMKPFKLDNMTNDEKERVKEHVLSFMDLL